MERANGACKAEEPYKRNTELAVLASRGDEEACAELVEMNMGLVRGAAQRFSGRGTETEDLIQLGCIGLIKAARSFDAEKGCAFSTYAVPLILGEIKRHLRDNGQMKVSRSIKKTGAELLRDEVLKLVPFRNVMISTIAPIVGASVGPGTVIGFCYGKEVTIEGNE